MRDSNENCSSISRDNAKDGDVASHGDGDTANSMLQQTDPEFNRVQLLYNSSHPPYLYGALQIIDGSIDNRRSTRPFIISRRKPNGEEVVYGTIARLLARIRAQIGRFSDFNVRSDEKLRSAGIDVEQQNPVLPRSDLTDSILEEQEELIEDVILTTSILARILFDLFPSKIKQYQVRILDYDGNAVGELSLKSVGDIIAHNRFMTIRVPYVVDLISAKQYTSSMPQMGLKFDFIQYLKLVGDTVDNVTVGDVVTKLRGMIKRLSAASNVEDIIFVTQNLYTLGGFVAGENPPLHAGPMKMLLDRLSNENYDRVASERNVRVGETVPFRAAFGRPTFRLEPDLDHKQIRTQMHVNGQTEALVMGYEDFFESVHEAVGGNRLM